MTILLAKRPGSEVPTATSDEHYSQLAADPTIQQFPQGSTYGGAMVSEMSPVPSAPQPVLTGAGENAAQNADVLVKNTNEDFINKRWRPFMSWTYMAICICDFILFPILWSLLQALSKGSVSSQYQPLSLQGAGLLHIAFGAVIGVATYGRTKEKLEGKQ
jgi:hypothetical protein